MAKLNTRVTDADRSNIQSRTTHMLQKRKGLVHKPWDTSPYRFYFNLLPTDIRNAVTLVNEKMEGKFKHFIHKNTEALIALRSPEDPKEELGRIQFRWKGEHPCLEQHWRFDDCLLIGNKHPAYALLNKFYSDCLAVEEENNKTHKLVEHVTATCNTFGQIHRVWPDLLPTIGGEKVAAAEGQQRKSQLPTALDTNMVFMERGEATTILAQAAILPEVTNTPQTWKTF